jgi:hypothetical protein
MTSRTKKLRPPSGTSTREKLADYHSFGKKLERACRGGSLAEAIRKSDWEKSRFTAYKAHQFAARVDEKELETYLGYADDGDLGWAHIIVLLRFKEQDDRTHWAAKCKTNNWSAEELRRHIANKGLIKQHADNAVRLGPPFKVLDEAEPVRRTVAERFERPLAMLNALLTPPSRLSQVEVEKVDKLRRYLNKWLADWAS